MESIWNNLPSFLYHLFDPDSPIPPTSHISITPITTTPTATTPITTTPTANTPITATTPKTATPTANTPKTATTPNTYNDIRDIMIR